MKLKVITGLSGSGKTSALRASEDMGYYAMDNVPAYLIEKFIELNSNQESPIEKMAVVIDVRSLSETEDLYNSLLRLKKANIDTKNPKNQQKKEHRKIPPRTARIIKARVTGTAVPPSVILTLRKRDNP